MHILLSYLSTNYSQLREHWKQHSILRSQGISGSDKPFLGELGGEIEIIDWETKKVVWSFEMDSPSGVFPLSSDLLAVNSIRKATVSTISISAGAIVGVVGNPLLNKPHSVVKSSKGYLISSTGLDSIVEIDSDGNSVYSFFLTLNGYPNDQKNEKREIDFNINHQGIEYPSLNQTTHVNYAKYLDGSERKILASLFHPGHIVLIDKETAQVDVLVDGLKNPHSIKPAKEFYLICNTSANRVLVFDSKFRLTKQLGEGLGMSWVQDAVYDQRSDSIFAADADNHRIIEMDWSNRVKSEYCFSRDKRIYELCPL